MVGLSKEGKRELKTQAHALKPTVWLGQQGLTPAVLAEVELALNAHELIKVKIPGVEREVRQQLSAEIVSHTSANIVQIIGQIATFYRKGLKHVSSSSAATSSKKR